MYLFHQSDSLLNSLVLQNSISWNIPILSWTRKLFSTGCTPNDTNSLETISHHLEDHISIIATFIVFMSYNVQEYIAISRMLSVNIRTLYNHRKQLGPADYGCFTGIANVDLDRLIAEILRRIPGSGETYITGSLRGWGTRVHRWRVRECLRTVDWVGRALRGCRAVQRRVYNVSAPN